MTSQPAAGRPTDRVRLGIAADDAVLGGAEGVDRFLAALDGELSALLA